MEKVYFSPGMDCLNAITSNLRKAKSNVKICVFTISDNRIVEVLKDLFYSGIRIKVISDNDKQFDKGNDVGYISSLGIDVKIDLTQAHMHHKFAVIDDEITITGSYNWTRSAEKYNHENILVTDSKKVAKEFTKEFDKLWNQMQEL